MGWWVNRDFIFWKGSTRHTTIACRHFNYALLYIKHICHILGISKCLWCCMFKTVRTITQKINQTCTAPTIPFFIISTVVHHQSGDGETLLFRSCMTIFFSIELFSKQFAYRNQSLITHFLCLICTYSNDFHICIQWRFELNEKMRACGSECAWMRAHTLGVSWCDELRVYIMPTGMGYGNIEDVTPPPSSAASWWAISMTNNAILMSNAHWNNCQK